MIQVYGIPTCGTVKKARTWLADNNLDYQFVDVREDGVSREQLESWAETFGWQKLVNKSSKAWRELSDADKQGLNEATSIELILAHPTLMKRPVVVAGDIRLLAFKPEEYEALL
jgi:arsenate reductase (glutaredoxin)